MFMFTGQLKPDIQVALSPSLDPDLCHKMSAFVKCPTVY